jgi:hypothetical protein
MDITSQRLLMASASKAPQGKTWTQIVSAATPKRIVSNTDNSINIAYSSFRGFGGAGNNILVYSAEPSTPAVVVPITDQTNDIMWDSANNRFIRYTNSGYYISVNGISWTYTATAPGPVNANSFAYLDGKYFAGDWNQQLWISYNGTSWSVYQSTMGFNVYDIAYGNSRYVAVGQSSIPRYSTDGFTWTSSNGTGGNASSLNRVKWVPFLNKFVAVGNSSYIFTSPNGITWTQSGIVGTNQNIYDFFYDQNTIYIPTSGGVYSSTDGITMTFIPMPNMLGLQMYAGYYSASATNKYLIIGDSSSYAYGSNISQYANFIGIRASKPNKLAYSSTASAKYVATQAIAGAYIGYSNDSINWTLSNVSGNTNTTISYKDILWDSFSNKYFTVGYGSSNYNEISYSTNGIDWVRTYTDTTRALNAIASNNAGTIVSLGSGGKLVYSTNNGSTWTASTITTYDQNILDVTWDSTRNQFIAVGANHIISTSSNGITWTLNQYYPVLKDIIKFAGKYIATGDRVNTSTSPYSLLYYSSNIKALWNPLFSSSFGQFQSGRFIITNPTSTIAVATGSNETYYSTDTVNGTTWIKSNYSSGNIQDLQYVNGYFMCAVASSTAGTFAISTDGATWIQKSVSSLYASTGILSLEFYNSYYYAYLRNGKIIKSLDMTTWVDEFDNTAAGTSQSFGNFVVAYGKLYAFSYSGNSYVYDGTNWSIVNNPLDTISQRFSCIHAALIGNNICMTRFGAPIYSTNGINWTAIVESPTLGDSSTYRVCNIGDGKVAFAAGISGTINFSHQVSTSIADGFTRHGRDTNYSTISYIANGDYVCIGAGNLLVLKGNPANNDIYSSVDNIINISLLDAARSFYNPIRVVSNLSNTNLSYASGSSMSGGPFYYAGSKISDWKLASPLVSTVNSIIWDGVNFIGVVDNGSAIYKSN